MKNTLLKTKQLKQIINNLHNKMNKLNILLYGVFNLATKWAWMLKKCRYRKF